MFPTLFGNQLVGPAGWSLLSAKKEDGSKDLAVETLLASAGTCSTSCGASGTGSSVCGDDPESAMGRPGRAQTKEKAAKKNLAPCIVCGLLSAEMPRGYGECWQHKRDADLLCADLKKQSQDRSATKEVKEAFLMFMKMRKAGTPAPSEYSQEILTYAQAHPSKGQGVSRGGGYNGFRRIEETVAETTTHKVLRLQ